MINVWKEKDCLAKKKKKKKGRKKPFIKFNKF